MDGYGRAVHIDAYFSTFPDEAGGWGAYLPTTGWEYDEQDDLWRSTYSTGSTFAVRYVEKTITECSAGYTARGCLSEVTRVARRSPSRRVSRTRWSISAA